MTLGFMCPTLEGARDQPSDTIPDILRENGHSNKKGCLAKDDIKTHQALCQAQDGDHRHVLPRWFDRWVLGDNIAVQLVLLTSREGVPE